MELTKRVLEYIRKNDLLHPGDKLILGVSGGADSVFLVHILASLRHDLSITFAIAHYNHRLRASSQKDETFVKNLALSLNLPYHQGRAIKDNVGIKISEESARNWRFEFFKKKYKQHKMDRLVLAHHQNDFVETVLMRMIRGTGLFGLRAIQPKINFLEMSIVRPCLCVNKDEILSFLKARRIPYCQDETNFNTDFMRNKIRLKLLPVLAKEYNPNIIDSISALGETAADDYDFLNYIMQQRIKENLVKFKGTVKIKLDYLRDEHPSMRRMVLRYGYGLLNGDFGSLGFSHIQKADSLIMTKPENSKLLWPNRLIVVKTKRFIILKNA